jgi:hypothetical protein
MNEERKRFEEKNFQAKKAEVEELLKQEGCPICRSCNDALERQWFWFFSESYGEGNGVWQYINYYGFCEKHTVEIARRGPPWQKSAIYSWIINNKLPELEEALRALEDKGSRGKKIIRTNLDLRGKKRKIESVKPKGSCLMCDLVKETAIARLTDLMKVLSQDSEVKELFRKSYGLCMTHFFAALDQLKQEYKVAYQEIMRVEIASLKELKIDFDEFFRKGDYRFANEPKGKEQTAWLRAVKRFIGHLDREEAKIEPPKKQSS